MAYQPTTNTTDQTASGSLGVLNATVPLVTNGAGTAIFEITGTWVGTITFEGSNNNFTTSQAVDTTFLGGIQTSSATTTINGFFSVLSGGFAKIQARMSSYTSGTATILANGSQADRIVVSRQGNPNNLQTLATLNTGSNSIGTVGLNTGSNTIGAVNVGTKTTGGATPFSLISAATTNATSVKASAGTVYSIQASNTGAAVAFLKLYNKASAPTVGTDVAVMTLILPAGGGIVIPPNDIGIAFTTGIAFAITGVATTADTTAVALAQVVINIDYI